MYPPKSKARREISFSESFETYNSRDCSEYSSPSVAYEPHINQASLQKKHSRSPLHNLHHKYLPSSYKLSLLQAECSKQSQSIKENRDGPKHSHMDAINKKIKAILTEIEQQQNRKDYYYERYAINVPEANRYKPHAFQQKSRLLSKEASRYQQFETPHKQSRSFKRKQSQSIDKNGVYSNMSSIESQHQFRTPLEELKSNSGHQPSGGKTSLSYLKKRTLKEEHSVSGFENSRQNQIMVGGKNVNSEIDRINARMQALNKMKEQMNINFSVESHHCLRMEQKASQSMSTTQMTITRLEPVNRQQVQAVISNHFQSVSFSKASSIVSSQLMEDNRGITVNTEDVSIPKVLRKATEKKINNRKIANDKEQQIVNQFKWEQPKSEPLSQETSNQAAGSCFQSITSKDDHLTQQRQNINSSRRVLTGIIKNQIKHGKKVAEKSEVSQPPTASQQAEFKRFFRHIQCQIRLDQYLRKGKQWFQRLKQASKWTDLQRCFFPSGFTVSQAITWQKIKHQLSLSDQQQNPFYTPRQSDFTIDQVCRAYKECNCYWQDNILHRYDIQLLRQANFRNQDLDLRGRGFISIEDLSRYFNYSMDTYYRNRDIYLIYQRFKTAEELYFDDIAHCLKR